jgi:hypothetical protein
MLSAVWLLAAGCKCCVDISTAVELAGRWPVATNALVSVETHWAREATLSCAAAAPVTTLYKFVGG